MCGIAFVLVAISSFFDQSLAEWVQRKDLRPLVESWPMQTIKSIGVYWFTVALAAAIGFFHRWQLRAASFVLLTGVIALFGNLMKWMVGRSRPFKYEPQLSEALPFQLRPFH